MVLSAQALAFNQCLLNFVNVVEPLLRTAIGQFVGLVKHAWRQCQAVIVRPLLI